MRYYIIGKIQFLDGIHSCVSLEVENMWLYLLVVIVALVYYLLQRNLNYWKKLKIPGPKPYPLVGNLGWNFIGRKSVGQIFDIIYRDYEGYPFVGVYKGGIPALLVRDLDFVRSIMVKDFKHFQDNDIIVEKSVDPIFGRNPFVLKGAEWKLKRGQLASCFSSGKIKAMYPFIVKNSKRMLRFVEDEMKMTTCLEAREIFVRFTLDNVATCAFGIDGNSFEDRNAEFRYLADNFFYTDGISSLKFLLIFTYPPIARLMKVKFVSKMVEDRLLEIVQSTLKFRKENNVVRKDFLDFVSALVEHKELFRDMDITAHAASFFTDGYETSSRVMALLLYEIARNPEVQNKLRKEIRESLKKTGGEYTYESIQEMKYLDACFYENLRKYAVLPQLQKVCTEKFTYTPTNPEYKNMTITVEEGQSVIIPAQSIQNDPKYWDNPEEFRPERFLEADWTEKFSFLAFGEGPRMCLGIRFGVTQIKVGIVDIINNYEVKPNPKTRYPVRFNVWYVLLSAVDGLWMDFRKIAF